MPWVDSMCAHPTAITASKHKNTAIFSSTFSVGQVAQSAVGDHESGQKPMCENYPTVTGPQRSRLMHRVTDLGVQSGKSQSNFLCSFSPVKALPAKEVFLTPNRSINFKCHNNNNSNNNKCQQYTGDEGAPSSPFLVPAV